MGSGIAQVVATAGLDVTIVELDEAALERGVGRIERGLAKAGDDGTARARSRPRPRSRTRSPRPTT